jgi:hypothetical protein
MIIIVLLSDIQSRLTHSQTRFLMSEFARQAHPDAAHRERLAREIPGLSPRQVQVWFQNRYYSSNAFDLVCFAPIFYIGGKRRG